MNEVGDVYKLVLGMLHDTLHMARCLKNMVFSFQNILAVVIHAGKCRLDQRQCLTDRAEAIRQSRLVGRRHHLRPLNCLND